MHVFMFIDVGKCKHMDLNSVIMFTNFSYNQNWAGLQCKVVLSEYEPWLQIISETLSNKCHVGCTIVTLYFK